MLTALILCTALIACSSPDEGGDADGGVSTDANTGGDAAPPQPSSDYVFDDGALRGYELEVSAADWQWLNENATLEEYVEATLRFEGREYGPVGLRYKGGFGTLQSCFDGQTRTCAKLSMKIKFNEYDPELRFYGLKKLNFHSMSSDPSALHDRLAYKLYRDMGVAGPRAVHATLMINDEAQGLFALIEQVDGRFTRRSFPDGGEGNLYKEVWPVYYSEQPYIDSLKTNEDESPTASRMVEFATALSTATDQTIEQVLSEWTDLDTLMAFLAVDRAVENWDGIMGWWCVGGGCGNHNFYWYEETGRDKVWLVPWDMDNTFDAPNPFVAFYGQPRWDEVTGSCDPVHIFDIGQLEVGRAPASCDPLIGWMGTALRDRYVAAAQALLAGPYSAAAVDADLDRWEAQIASAVAADSNGPSTAEWAAAVAELRDNIAQLRSDMGAVLP